MSEHEREALEVSIARLEVKVDNILENMDKGSRRMDSQDSKIQDIQKNVWIGTGIAVGISSIATYLTKKLL